MNQRKRVAVVTGGARGIGLGIAEKFLAEGYGVALLDIDATSLSDTAARLGSEVLAIECDVALPAQVHDAIAQVVVRDLRVPSRL